MSGTKQGSGQGLWRALTLIGVLGVALGLIAHVLILGLLAPPFVIAGLIGRVVSARKSRRQA